ncbi:hypothetical protein LTR08_008633 [Meristemomyces frigidus]|nr:hypothetical protein LTR08_008633 [Meristemomyces frigidus]
MSPPEPRPIFVAIIGVGGVGTAFLPQLDHVRRTLAARHPPIDLRLILARRTTTQVLAANWHALDIPTLATTLAASHQPLQPLPELLAHLATAPGSVILVDNTSSLDVARAYPAALRQGLSIVTPNKKAFSDSYELWQAIFNAAANGPSPTSSPNAGYILHESSVGAGLPLLTTLADLLATGDTLTKIEGVFSGTMSFLFNTFNPVTPDPTTPAPTFSASVTTAKALGYTEPDPRDDLNGLDVARKLTILARLAHIPIPTCTSFPVQSLIPPPLATCTSGSDFLAQLPHHDTQMDDLKASAANQGKVIRFVGSIDVASQTLKVGLESFDVSHPIAALKGSDNIVSFYTKRYGDNPLIIQGAGAGGEVTAMGVTADLLRVVQLLQ